MLDTRVRIGEALSLQWADVHLVPITTARYGLVRIRGGKSKNAKRHIPLTERIREMLVPARYINRSEPITSRLIGDWSAQC